MYPLRGNYKDLDNTFPFGRNWFPSRPLLPGLCALLLVLLLPDMVFSAGQSVVSLSTITIPYLGCDTTVTMDGVYLFSPKHGWRTGQRGEIVEATVTGGRIGSFSLGDSPIPADGIVLCGAGKGADDLMNYACVGSSVYVNKAKREIAFGPPLCFRQLGDPLTWKDFSTDLLPSRVHDKGLMVILENRLFTPEWLGETRTYLHGPEHSFVKWFILRALFDHSGKEIGIGQGLSLVEDLLQVKMNHWEIEEIKGHYYAPIIADLKIYVQASMNAATALAEQIQDKDLMHRISQWRRRVEHQIYLADGGQSSPWTSRAGQKDWDNFIDQVVAYTDTRRRPNVGKSQVESVLLLGLRRYECNFQPSINKEIPISDLRRIRPFILREDERFRSMSPSMQMRYYRTMLNVYGDFLLDVFSKEWPEGPTKGPVPEAARAKHQIEVDQVVPIVAQGTSLAFRMGLVDATFADSFESVTGSDISPRSTWDKYRRQLLRERGYDAEKYYRNTLDTCNYHIDDVDPDNFWKAPRRGQAHPATDITWFFLH